MMALTNKILDSVMELVTLTAISVLWITKLVLNVAVPLIHTP